MLQSIFSYTDYLDYCVNNGAPNEAAARERVMHIVLNGLCEKKGIPYSPFSKEVLGSEIGEIWALFNKSQVGSIRVCPQCDERFAYSTEMYLTSGKETIWICANCGSGGGSIFM